MIARRACIGLLNIYRNKVVDILLRIVYTSVPRKNFRLCNPFKMGGASSQEPRAVTVEEVEEDDGQARINVRDARTGEAYFRNVSIPPQFVSL